ncbi:MAG TPA: hypothetical protein VGL81_01515 [Polyangiaceae bacterium]|jgi:hypothetical protein
MNPYAAPGTVSTGMEDDVAAAVPTPLVRLSGAAIALGGGVVGLTGLQTLMFTMRGPIAIAPYALLGVALPHLVLGVMVFRARAWAALVSIPGCFLLSLVSGAWLVVAIGHLLFSLYALAAPMVSVAALVFAFLGLGPCQRASAARARLRAQGMDLGI